MQFLFYRVARDIDTAFFSAAAWAAVMAAATLASTDSILASQADFLDSRAACSSTAARFSAAHWSALALKRRSAALSAALMAATIVSSSLAWSSLRLRLLTRLGASASGPATPRGHLSFLRRSLPTDEVVAMIDRGDPRGSVAGEIDIGDPRGSRCGAGLGVAHTSIGEAVDVVFAEAARRFFVACLRASSLAANAAVAAFAASINLHQGHHTVRTPSSCH